MPMPFWWLNLARLMEKVCLCKEPGPRMSVCCPAVAGVSSSPAWMYRDSIALARRTRGPMARQSEIDVADRSWGESL
jgi:hypothetical protein